MKKIAAALIASVSVFTAMAAEAPLWMRDVRISPDGSRIAFTYKGDIYCVPVSGGEAQRLTSRPSYESEPVWSPDGKLIAFASDREGSQDVFVMDAAGGPARRLTVNTGSETPEAFTTDGRYVLFSASIQDPVKSAAFPSGRLTELYKVPVGGGRYSQVLGTPALRVSPSADGAFFLYEDCKGMENQWRKHHTSSVTRDIWRYDIRSGRHTNLTAHAGEDRDPVLSPDGKSMYFLSERDGGDMNVYSQPLDGSEQPKALTSFKGHPVRFLSAGADGTLAFGYNGEIYTMKPGAEPQKVAVSIKVDDYNPVEYVNVTSGGGSGVVSPDGKQVAFVRRGELFVTSVEYPTTRQITSTAVGEGSPAWSPDNRTLYYTSERDGMRTVYKATIADRNEPNFPNATVIKEERVIDALADGIERTAPRVSPDGKRLAYVEDGCRLMVKDLKSGAVKQITDGSGAVTRTGVDYSWSPDSRWIVFTTVDNLHEPYCDVAIVNVDGKPEVTNITQSGYFDESPSWTADGNALVFLSERYGMRNHASWGSLSDVMIVFMNRDAMDRFRLNKEDFELLTEAEKKAKTDEPTDKKEEKKDKKGNKDSKQDAGDKKKDKETVKPVVVERDGIDRRIMRLTPYSANLASPVVAPDGKKLYFLNTVGGKTELMSLDLRESDLKQVSRLDAGSYALQFDKAGKNMFILGSAGMKKMELSGEKIKPITYSAKMKLDHAAEREAMFDVVKRQEKSRFYCEDMHGVDWEALTENYRRFLPHINNNYDFSEMLSELLGELNVSHTGSGYRAAGASAATGNLGLLYDLSYTGKGLKVAEVVAGGPFDKASVRLKAGSIIEAVNGEELTADAEPSALLNGLVGKKTLITSRTDGKRVDDVVRPISNGAMSDLLYERWVRQRAADVDRLSGGRLGYVHIRSMNDGSFRPLYADVLGKYNTREGIVIDTRWNGGGRMHEDIEVMFSGKKYLTQTVKGVPSCDMPSRRWNKPSIMLQCEANYSNAHGTPWVYKTRGIGKLVGMPVPGTMTSVNWVTLQDPTLYFGIPVIGYKTAEGNYLENTQLEPDIKVANDPAGIVKGEDAQLRRAVEELLKEIDSSK